MTELIEKLERADKGRIELDALIGAHIGFDGWSPQTWQEFLGRDDVFPPQAKPSNLPSYTTSLDAALTLVSEGWEWSLHCEHGKYRVEIGSPKIGLESGPTTLPALALCIAALKARVVA